MGILLTFTISLKLNVVEEIIKVVSYDEFVIYCFVIKSYHIFFYEDRASNKRGTIDTQIKISATL